MYKNCAWDYVGPQNDYQHSWKGRKVGIFLQSDTYLNNKGFYNYA